MSLHLLGIGSPLVDYTVEVAGEFVDRFVPGGKGCTRHISAAEKKVILRAAENEVTISPGGAAANTVRAFAMLGGSAAIFGKAGSDDEAGFFSNMLLECNADDSLLLRDSDYATGFCITLVTPDAERTMLSDLAASRHITEADIRLIDFSKFDWILLEGYLCMEAWVPLLLQQCRKYSCKVAIDLNNFESVRMNRDFFQKITSGIDLLFANEAEAEALFPGDTVNSLARHCRMSVLKRGAKGATVIAGQEIINMPADSDIGVKDTTGAGDFFAAGFFFGMDHKLPLPACARCATLFAQAIIVKIGTRLEPDERRKLSTQISREVLV